MKKLPILTIAALLLAILVSFTRINFFEKPITVKYSTAVKYRTAIPCSPTAWLLLDSSMPTIPPLTGWGNYSWKVNSKSDSARFFFNQGINLYYGFHIIESQASFQKSAMFDPGFALAYWGQALAYGPNINDAGYYVENPKAWPAIQKAVSLLNSNSNTKEKALINAQLKHFSPDSTVDRTALNNAYATEMKKLYQQFGDDPDVASLYADALMNLHPWDLYDHSGNPHTWTPEITALLEKILKKYPSHPAAIHYYIHSVEASNDPGRALPYADKLGALMPDVAHMVHMPSHIYIRTGLYEKGIKSNEEAVKAFGKYVALFPPSEGNAPLYYLHNVDMQAANAAMAGRYADAQNYTV
jgi:tetratricopeptide (TPR) repeat protein